MLTHTHTHTYTPLQEIGTAEISEVWGCLFIIILVFYFSFKAEKNEPNWKGRGETEDLQSTFPMVTFTSAIIWRFLYSGSMWCRGLSIHVIFVSGDFPQNGSSLFPWTEEYNRRVYLPILFYHSCSVDCSSMGSKLHSEHNTSVPLQQLICNSNQNFDGDL